MKFRFTLTAEGWVAYVDDLWLCRPNTKEDYARKIATRAYNKCGTSSSKVLVREENGHAITLKSHTGDNIIR